LARKGIGTLIERLGDEVCCGSLDELTLATNGSRLAKYADAIVEAGVRRINVSLDTLKPDVFERITRRAALNDVLAGIDAAREAGLAVKINTVALKHLNEDEIPAIVEWAHARGMDLSLIEVMPLGDVDEDRLDQYLPLPVVRKRLKTLRTLTPIAYRAGGPARYFKVEETGGRLGFITPLTQNSCDGCNRVRLTSAGELFMCLGHDEAMDFAPLLPAGASDATLDGAIDDAISRKPRAHDFIIETRCATPPVTRPMPATGG
jgi:cyclic pyranopterin phosphate synthase